jgi:hypothetical protein
VPWQIDGTFLRINPDFSGDTVWSQDQQASIRIIATRHDIHDTDLADGIADCLNLDGYSTMRAALKMGNYQITGLANGTSADHAVTKSQLDGLQAQVDQNTTDISNIGTENDLITAQSFDGATFTSTRANGDFTTTLNVMSSFQTDLLRVGTSAGNGEVKQRLIDHGTGNATVDIGAAPRHHVDNTGSLTITLSGLPTSDAVFGNTYEQEGMIVVDNGASPGTITLATAGEVIGAQSLNANIRQVLTYIIQRIGGTNNITYIWSVSG